jgi:hypothetical protein
VLKDDALMPLFMGALSIIFPWSEIGFEPRLLMGEKVEENLRRRSFLARKTEVTEGLKVASMFVLMFRVWLMKDEWIREYLIPWMDSALRKPPTAELGIAVSAFVKQCRFRMYAGHWQNLMDFYVLIENGCLKVLMTGSLKCFGVPLRKWIDDDRAGPQGGRGDPWNVLPDVSYDDYMRR